MDASLGEPVWESGLDGKYICKVLRTGEYTGRLLMYDENAPDTAIVDRPVGLSYGAIFGPDTGDVYEWQTICLEAADNEVEGKGESEVEGDAE